MNTRHAFDFEWDAAKALSNASKHGVTFDQAATVFLDPLTLTEFDKEHSADEERWFTMGIDSRGVLLAVAHTIHESQSGRIHVRLISARRATSRERHHYENHSR